MKHAQRLNFDWDGINEKTGCDFINVAGYSWGGCGNTRTDCNGVAWKWCVVVHCNAGDRGTCRNHSTQRGGATNVGTCRHIGAHHGQATSSTPTVAARAATTQKVLNAGTSVQAANENTVIQNQCREKYYGCMDSFCMLDNENGGRCICSDKNAEYDQILADIERLDQQSYQMATVGVESIESGFDATAAISSVVKDDSGVDLSLWDAYTVMDDLDSGSANPLSGKEGDALFNASHQLCAQQMPECNEQLSMLSLMYRQQIRSDCTAYENSLNQQKQASQQKLAAAQTALRQASYEQLQAANKYDLGQCTVEFKNCMITTGGCGDDFAGCATVAAFDATNTRGRGVGTRPYVIKGDKTDIEISASTYDILYSKKPLCDGITQQCVAVADQVWDTFLREAAPQIKNAELIAEDNARVSDTARNNAELMYSAVECMWNFYDVGGRSRGIANMGICGCAFGINACEFVYNTIQRMSAIRRQMWFGLYTVRWTGYRYNRAYVPV